MGKALRLCACGGGDFGLPALAALRAAGHELALLVTPPPRPAGRGRELTPCPAERWGRAQGVPLLAAADVNAADSVAAIAAASPDVLFVVDFGQILRAPVLGLPRLAAVNLHGSLLPALRGAEPVRRAVLDGLAETGVTTITMDERVDTGGILLQAALPVAADETCGSLRAKLAALGAEVTVRTLAGLADGTLRPRPQDGTRASLAKKLAKEERVIDWSRPAVEIDRRVRGLAPAPGAHTLRAGKRLLIGAVRPAAGSGRAGTVVALDPLTVAAGDGLLEMVRLQPEGKKDMTAAEFTRGYRPAFGEQWGG